MSLPLANPVRSSFALIIAVLLIAALTVTTAPPAFAYPPNIPSKSAAQSELNALTVRGEWSMTGYSRDKFPHWIGISGNCNTRETVLKRDGSNVTVNTACYPTSGSWYSTYDGVTKYSPSEVSIDHIVALAEAWRSGASSWTTDRRRAFANDLNGPELIAVTVSSNSSKGDRDAASWRPSRTSGWCIYSKMVIRTKYKWRLAVQAAEKSALQDMLNRCYY